MPKFLSESDSSTSQKIGVTGFVDPVSGNLGVFSNKTMSNPYAAKDAKIMDHPWHASLQLLTNSGWRHVCSGSILTPKEVVTGAHCCATQGFAYGSWRIVAGTANITARHAKRQTAFVNELVIHPGYDNFTFDNDICKLYLDAGLEFSETVSPIDLCLEATNGTNLVATGWLTDARITSPILQEISSHSDPRIFCQLNSGGPLVHHYWSYQLIGLGLDFKRKVCLAGIKSRFTCDLHRRVPFVSVHPFLNFLGQGGGKENKEL